MRVLLQGSRHTRRFVQRNPALPKKPIDRSLLFGNLLFGLGWGLAGYCPGPALAGLALGNDEVLVFLVAMLAGGFLPQRWERQRNDL